MEEINIRDMVKLNHTLSLKHFWVKFRKEGDYDVYMVPINKQYNPEHNKQMFDIITDFYDKLGLDVMIDETMMCYHLYKK